MKSLPTAEDVAAAAQRIAPHISRTPLLESPALNERLGARLLLKAENLQFHGSFKIRGAMNHVLQLPDNCVGVVAYSSGNHAQGVAAAARHRGVPCVILMPSHAPSVKLDAVVRLGAEVLIYKHGAADRVALAKNVVDARGYHLVPPFDDPWIIAGNGTVGLELAEQAIERGTPPDIVIICCGGGGLSSGSALALKHALPTVKVFAAEPENYDDTRLSLCAGRRIGHQASSPTICDALLTPIPGELTFALNRRLLEGSLVVSDDEVRRAVRVAAENLRIVLEPSGAVSLATVLEQKIDVRDRTFAVVTSRGNVDLRTLAKILH